MNKFILGLILVFVFGFAPIQAQNYSTHKVKNGETIEAIAKRYHVTPYDIYALNPDAKKGLKPNAVLIIPKSKIAAAPKATVIKTLNGFKKHKVKRRETLYSLSKKFDVTEEDIKKHNTFLYSNNLRKGDRLKIPVFKKTLKIEEVIETTKQYTVKPKEGKWRIAYKFGITVDELKSLNPNMSEILKVGESITVPNINLNDEKQIDEAYSYYTVLPKEGFYRLKLKLDVEQGILEALNPGLKETGLKSGMVLKIPFNSSEPQSDGVESESTNLLDSIISYDTKRLAIMLPFKLNSVDLDSIGDTKRQINRDPYLKRSLDFHSGVLVALDSLKKIGISVKVDVYDTENRLSEVAHIVNTNNFENVDAVIGPLMPKNLEKVASDLRIFNVPVISPITKNVKLYENVFQSRPSEQLLESKTINYVKEKVSDKHIIIIADSKHRTKSDKLKREFGRASQVYSRKSKKGKDQNYILVDDVKNVLKLGDNIVFLETTNEGFVSNVTSVLNSLIKKKSIEERKKGINIILTTTNKNKAFEGDEVSNYHLSNLQFHFASASKPYDEENNNPFIKSYRAIYGVTPNDYAVKGFDLTMDVVLRLATSNNLFSSVNKSPLTEYVENKFAYKKKLFGGYYNDTAYLLKYSDLKIVEVED